MHIYIYIYIHTYIYAYVCICICIYKHTYIHTYIHAYIHARIHTCTWNYAPGEKLVIHPGTQDLSVNWTGVIQHNVFMITPIHVCKCTCIQAFVCVRVCVCIYIYMLMYIYMYTHIYDVHLHIFRHAVSVCVARHAQTHTNKHNRDRLWTSWLNYEIKHSDQCSHKQTLTFLYQTQISWCKHQQIP